MNKYSADPYLAVLLLIAWMEQEGTLLGALCVWALLLLFGVYSLSHE